LKCRGEILRYMICFLEVRLSLGICRVKGITADDFLRLCYSVGRDVVTLVRKLVFRERHKNLIQSVLTAVYPGRSPTLHTNQGESV
jgi:hypothetical protein